MSEEIENEMSEPLFNEDGKRLPKTAWPKGKSGNPAGRPRAGTEKSKGKPRSRMRSTLTHLFELTPIAKDKLEKLLKMEEGKLTDLEKTQIDVSKWLIKTVESYSSTCLREELAVLGIREKNQENADALEENNSVEDVAPSKFSMELAETTLKH